VVTGGVVYVRPQEHTGRSPGPGTRPSQREWGASKDTVRAALESLQSSGFTTHGIDQCESSPGLAWHVQSNGDILLTP
jgi:hypothetical protein